MRRLIPAFIKRRLREQYREAEKARRQKQVDRLVRVPLEEAHVRNCRILLNRRAMLQEIGKRNVVAELGVDHGEFSEVLLEITRPDVLHLVDVWASARYHEGLFDEVMARFKERIDQGIVQIHRKLSTEAADDFEDATFDLIYIDTDHSYETTNRELLAYAPKMKADGIIAGHDYSMGNWVASHRYGVIEAVHEFCVKSGWEILYLTAEPLESNSFAIRKMPSDG